MRNDPRKIAGETTTGDVADRVDRALLAIAPQNRENRADVNVSRFEKLLAERAAELVDVLGELPAAVVFPAIFRGSFRIAVVR